MKAKFGTNQKWIVAPSNRDAIRKLFVEVLSADVKSPRPDLEVYVLSDGSNVGVFVDEAALTPAQARMGAWLEFAVEDVEAAIAATRKIGIQPIEYVDKSYTYFQAPGGPVYRYAKI